MAILNTSFNLPYSFNGRVVSTPVPSDFDGLLYPWGGGMIILFFNDRKGWGNDKFRARSLSPVLDLTGWARGGRAAAPGAVFHA